MEVKTDINKASEFQSINIQESNKKYEGYGSTSQLDSSPLLQLAVGKSCVKKLTEYEFNTEKLEPGVVGVYIWNSGFQGGEGVGHISVGFGEEYVSFWPNSGYKRVLMCSGQLPKVREADVFYLLKTNENDFQIYPSKAGKLETETLNQEQCHALCYMQKLPEFPVSGNEPIEITGIDNRNLINSITEICGCRHWLGDKKTQFGEFDGYWVKERRGDIDKKDRCLPDYVFHVRGLNIEQMQEKFEEIKSIVPKWHLLASTPLKKENSLNCVAVAIEILRAGEIEELAGEKIIKQEFDKSTSSICQDFITIALVSAVIFSNMYLYFIGAMKIFYSKTLEHWFKEYPALRIMTFVVLGFFPVMIILMFIDYFCCRNKSAFYIGYTGIPGLRLIAYSVEQTLGFPYDSIRGLYEHSSIPSGKIIEILNKAVENSNKIDSKCTVTSDNSNGIDSIDYTSGQIILDLEKESRYEHKNSYLSVFSEATAQTEKTMHNRGVPSCNNGLK